MEVNIFKAGTVTDSRGHRHVFTRQDLLQVVESFNPTYYRVPLVRGHNHPQDDAEACGWVTRVWVEGELLWAEIEPRTAFKQELADGAYKSVSCSFYTPQSPLNPYPGKLSLRHLGFVLVPAVKGLLPFTAFAEFKDCHIDVTMDIMPELDYSEPNPLLEQIEVAFSEEIEQEAAEILLAELTTQYAESERRTRSPRRQAQQAEPAKEAEIIEQPPAAPAAPTAELEETVKQLKAQLAAQEKAMKKDRYKQFAEQLYSEGRLTSGIFDQQELINLLVALDEVSPAADFSEENTLVAGIKNLLMSMPVQVSYAELPPAPPETTATATTTTTGSSGYNSPPDSLDLHQRVLEYAEQNKCDYVTALKRVVG